MDSNKNTSSENRVCVTTDSGNTIWIPESKLSDWENADHSAPLTEKERELLNQMKERIYGRSSSAGLSESSNQSTQKQNGSPSYLSPRIFVHDPHGGGHWEEYTPGEDRPPDPPELPVILRRSSPRSSSDSSIREELRYTKRCLGSARSEINALTKKISSYQAQIKVLKNYIRLIIIVSIVLSIFLCCIVSSSVSSKYKRFLDGSYSDGESVGYDAGYDDGYRDGKKAKSSSVSSSSNSNWSPSTIPENTGATRDTAISIGYIGNTETRKYHYSTCSYLPDKNHQVVFSSAEDAELSGYDPCLRCNPR